MAGPLPSSINGIPDHEDRRLGRFTRDVASILNSLIRTGLLSRTPAELNEWQFTITITKAQIITALGYTPEDVKDFRKPFMTMGSP